MFEKLLALLPYNPGLLHQMSFYSRRMREEAAIRRTGLIFIVLAFMVQFFAVIAPPTLTSAASSNDLVNGGFSSASQAANDCTQNLEDYGNILSYYGITCKEVANSPTVTIQSTDHERQLYSMGRINYSLPGETPVTIDHSSYYLRYLWGWDTHGKTSSYPALRILSSNGTLFYLLKGCGNLTSVGLPQPVPSGTASITTQSTGSLTTTPTPTLPKLQIIKTSLDGYAEANSKVAPGATLGYKIYVNNSGDAADGVSLLDTLPNDTSFQYLSPNAGATIHAYNATGRTAEWAWPTIPQETNAYTVELEVTVNPNATNGEQICNTAQVAANGVSPITSNQICMTVEVNAPPPPITTTPTPTPVIPTPTPNTPTPCALDTSIPATSSECKPCEASLSTQDTLACVTVHKTAANLTQNISDANNTTAQPNDVIVYTLYADNTGKSAVDQFNFQENLNDVMDYADPTDLHGGTIDSNDIVSWPSISIPAGQTATQEITVKVKGSIPSTPVDPSNPEHFNLVMTNLYGNTININVPTPPTVAVQTAAASLPNTGPGSGVVIAAAIVIIGAYFYYRSRLLATESSIAVHDNTGF